MRNLPVSKSGMKASCMTMSNRRNSWDYIFKLLLRISREKKKGANCIVTTNYKFIGL